MASIDSRSEGSGFRRFWIGQGISELGTGVTVTVIPIIAVVLLKVRPVSLGLMTAAATVSGVLLRPLAGWWADRRPRLLPRIVAINIVLAATAAVVPVLWLLGVLSLGALVAALVVHVALSSVAATLTVPVVPRLVDSTELLGANGRLQAINAASQVGGPALAGLLLLAVSPPWALLVDAVSFLICALATWTVVSAERVSWPDQAAADPISTRVPERASRVTPYLRRQANLLGYMICLCACGGIGASLLPVFAIRALDLSGASVSALLALGAVGGVLGGATANRLSARFAERHLLVFAAVLASVSFACLVPAQPGIAGAALVAAYELLGSMAGVLAVVLSVTRLQRFLPEGLMGRGLALFGTLCAGGTAIGAGMGGALAEPIGQRGVFAIAIVLGGVAAILISLPRSPASQSDR